VHDVEGLARLVAELVDGVEARERVEHHAEHHPEGDRPRERRGRRLDRRQGVALDVVHRGVQELVVAPDVEHPHDVGVLDAGREPGLLHEHLHEGLVVREVRVHHLHRHHPLEGTPRPAEPAAPEVDAGHPADADAGHEVEAPRAGRRRA